MSKAVLVMDMPKECGKCNLYDPEYDVCEATDKYVRTFGKPDWCPLRELPGKAEVSDCGELCDTDDWYDSGYADGYNACIDELLGGKHGKQ